MSEQTQLAEVKPQAVAIGPVIQSIMTIGVRPEDVQSLAMMMQLQKEQTDKQEERDFAAAFHALQKESVNVRANKPVPGKDGIKFVYANFQEIMDQVSPLLGEHGFSLSFEPQRGEKTVTMTCVLQHVSGHSKKYSMEVRIGTGPPGSSECQADGAAYEYAKRLALCSALNIVVDKSDVKIEGDAITPEQAAHLESRLRAVNGDVQAFLKLAKAASFADIRSARYGMLDRALTTKEKGSK